MSLVTHSPSDLQAMLDIVTQYAFKWEYSINPSKSQIIIVSNKPSIRSQFSTAFSWSVCSKSIPIVESATQLGILISSSSSTIERTTGRIASSRSAFYALSAVGTRHTGINPLTSLLLYKSICLPILSFGLEVWHPTATEVNMLERSQLRVLRTILGLPVRASAAGIHLLLGTIPIKYISQIKLLTFVRSTMGLPESAVARRLLALRVNQSSSPSGSITHEQLLSFTACQIYHPWSLSPLLN